MPRSTLDRSHASLPTSGGPIGAARRLSGLLLDPRVVALTFVLLSVGIGLQRHLLGDDVIDGRRYTHYNNYVIFKASFAHLRNGQDLYILYPEEHWDLFKYSPTFAALMAPFAMLPDVIGMLVWQIAGSLLLWAGLWRAPVADERARMMAAWLAALPLVQSLQNAQSNAHVAGLMLLAFAWLERMRASRAGLAVAFALFIKIYGALAILGALLYRGRARALALFACWVSALAFLPLLFVSPRQLAFLYSSWANLLAADQSASTGVSVMGWLHNWFGVDPPKLAVVAGGAALMSLPLLLLMLRRSRAHTDPTFRAIFMAALLIWVVIFNHKAEPNTFVIAVAGVGLWYIAQPPSLITRVLAGSVFVFTCVSTTSVFPVIIRRTFVQPYSMRVVPCILVWAAAIWDLMLRTRRA
jgi:hypothetical protein